MAEIEIDRSLAALHADILERDIVQNDSHVAGRRAEGLEAPHDRLEECAGCRSTRSDARPVAAPASAAESAAPPPSPPERPRGMPLALRLSRSGDGPGNRFRYAAEVSPSREFASRVRARFAIRERRTALSS